jgi:energy-coupling factor transport system ATP-binding protein
MNVSIDQVSFAYPGGVQALRGVSLEIVAGESVALIGENGAGKSTLAKHLNGLLKPDSGQVRIGDWDTRDHSVAQMAARVGFVFQNPDDQLFARRVWDEVAFGPQNLGRKGVTVEQDVDQALQQVSLADAAERHPYDLQAAQRKLVTLAAILAMRTAVIILDEPTMSQDAQGIALVGRIIEQLKRDQRTVLVISHDMEFCAAHFNRVVVLSAGQIVADGPAGQILGQQALLSQAGVEPPQLARLALALGWSETPLHVETFLQTFEAHQQKE